MCRSITYRYSICMHSWRPYVIPCLNPVKDNSTDINTTNTCLAYKIRYERRVIKSGNGLCAACWEKQERKEKYVKERERILEGKMMEMIVGKGEKGLERRFREKDEEGKGGGKEKEDARKLECIDEALEVVLEERVVNLKRERKENTREKDDESEKLLQETEKKTWILEGNGRVRKKLDGNERKVARYNKLG